MDGLRSVEIAWGRPRCRERDGSAALEEAPDERAWIVKRGNSLGGGLGWEGAMQKCKAGGAGFSGQFHTISIVLKNCGSKTWHGEIAWGELCCKGARWKRGHRGRIGSCWKGARRKCGHHGRTGNLGK